MGPTSAISGRRAFVSILAVVVVLVLTIFSIAFFPATANGKSWEMTDRIVDAMDLQFILSNFLPPAVLVLSCILFLDTLPGHSRDVDVALLARGDASKVTSMGLWRARWRLTMGKIVGGWSIGEILMVVALVICNILWWAIPVISRTVNPPPGVHVHGKKTELRIMFDRIAGWAGWAGLWDGGAAILFAIRENQLLKKTIGAGRWPIPPHDSLPRWSRLHFFFGYIIDNKFAFHMYPWVSTVGYYNAAGFISWLALVVVAATSIFKVRRKNYRLFYWSHQLYIVFILFSLIHYYGWWTFVGPLLYFVYDRFAPSLRFKRQNVAFLKPLNDTTLRIDVPIPEEYRLASTYAPGDWMNINVPEISRLNWHPFSIASYHTESPDFLTFYIKVRGEWTKQLHSLAKTTGLNTPVPVKMDGPFGAKSTSYLDFETLVLVGVERVWRLSFHLLVITLTAVPKVANFTLLPNMVGSNGSVQIFLTRNAVVELGSEDKTSLLMASVSPVSPTVLSDKKVVLQESACAAQPVLHESASSSPEARTSYFRLLSLNVLLAIACFGGGVSGYAFGRIVVFDFNMDTCMGRTAQLTAGTTHFLCWYWYYFAPVLMPVIFATSFGLLILLISSYLVRPSIMPTALPVRPNASTDPLPSTIQVEMGRPNLKMILGGILAAEPAGTVAFMASGPERMVLDVQEMAVSGMTKKAHFFRESFKV
ncbi:FAD-binding domain-containing protein [Chytridium lagenaria]|nr:FAD-binding domain-containing protein [Chytridium lagenaria]